MNMGELNVAIANFKAKTDVPAIVPARARRFVFNQIDVKRLMFARSFQDKHYQQKIQPGKY